MNHESRQPDDRVEGLLRQWGAEEATRLADTAAAPAFAPRPRAPWAALRRWAPLAAASLLLAASAAFFVAARSGADADLERLRARLDQATQDLDHARSGLAEVQRDSGRQSTDFQQELARLRTDLEAQKADLARQAETRALALTRSLQDKQQLLDDALRELGQRQKEVTDLQHKLAENDASLGQLRTAFADTTARLRQSSEEADDARRDAETRLAALQEQHSAMLAILQDVYLAAGTPPQQAILARRTTAAQSRLIERCHELRGTAVSPTARELFDSLEVLLTRLELLDVKDPAQRGSFTALLAATDLTRKINSVLLDEKEDVRVRAWLLETQLVLAGVELVY
jgi:septal ring factor EnvC (AmiA/AmiB activator)